MVEDIEARQHGVLYSGLANKAKHVAESDNSCYIVHQGNIDSESNIHSPFSSKPCCLWALRWLDGQFSSSASNFMCPLYSAGQLYIVSFFVVVVAENRCLLMRHTRLIRFVGHITQKHLLEEAKDFHSCRIVW